MPGERRRACMRGGQKAYGLRSLYLRIWLTVVAALLLFALVAGWLVQRTIELERTRSDSAVAERFAAWGELIQRSLPSADAPRDEQAAALQDWSQRLRLPLALDDRDGKRIVASDVYLRRENDAGPRRVFPIALEDGRTLWLMRGPRPSRGGAERDGGAAPWFVPPGLRGVPGIGVAALLALLFAAVAAGAYPVVRRLTRRLETLKRGVEAFGEGALHQRVAESGRDEVASLAASFNRAAARIETLVRSHRSLLANASHELRSPLARLKMALSMLDEAPPGPQRASLQREIATDIAELDALVEEILLASRLDAASTLDKREPVDLLALAAEEAARGGNHCQVEGDAIVVAGDERLLRRALRNLLENARRYGGDDADVRLRRKGAGTAELSVCDRGPGVPEAFRERIFEPFFRLPGHAEREGGVGLGLSLVRQIVTRHGGAVRCEPRDGGGSCFVLDLPIRA
jgi:signal transduction histidine kinase